MYSDVFCRIYDLLGWNYYPLEFAPRLLRWAEENGMRAESCLDLGCGTGILCAELAGRGLRTLGADLSAGMIETARKNAPGLTFVCGDMTAFRPEESFDFVTCTGDALNHVFDFSAVERTFANVYSCLAPGGAFVFDLLSREEIPAGEPFELEFSPELRATFSAETDGESVSLFVSVFEQGAAPFTEEIREKLHDPEMIRAALERTGFSDVRLAHRLLPDDAEAATWFVTARKIK